jgi:hypothetical protein
MNRTPNNFLPNPKNWRVDGEYLISTWFIFVKPFYNVQKQLNFFFINLVFWLMGILNWCTATCFCSFPWRWYRQSISKWFFVKSLCQFPFPLSLESWHLLNWRVDGEYLISTWFIFVKPFYNVQKQLNCNVIQREFSIWLINTLSTFRRCQDSRGLFTKNNISI